MADLSKLTKAQLIEEYNKLMAKQKAEKAADKVQEKKVEHQVALVKVADANSVERILATSSTLKGDLVKTVELVEEKLLAAQREYTSITAARDLAAKELEEIHGIQAEMGSLDILRQLHSEQEADFNLHKQQQQAEFHEQMAVKKAEWAKEQQEHAQSVKERNELIEKSRKREEEEYKYNRDVARRAEADAYEREKEAQERELASEREVQEAAFATREAALSAREEELQSLREKVANFPAELEKAVKAAEGKATAMAKHAADVEMKLLQKDVETERRLAAQTIESQQTKITELLANIAEYKETAREASNKVEKIATEAVQSASKSKVFVNSGDSEPESGRSRK